MTRREALYLLMGAGIVPLVTSAPARAGQSYFPPGVHQAIIDDPLQISAVYRDERARFADALGPEFAREIEEHLKFGFCSLFAYDHAPYGPCVATALADLLVSPFLDCDNYAILTWRLFLLLCPTPTTRIAAVGWNGGVVGNHVQVIAHKAANANGQEGGDWLVDPTVGIIVCGHSFDRIASGRPVDRAYMRTFFWRGDIDEDHSRMVDALTRGQYKPSDLLYYVSDLERFISPPQMQDWMTPQADAMTSGRTFPLLTLTSLTADKASPQVAGTAVTFTADASGGVAPYQYKWWLNTGTGYVVLRDWAASNTLMWTPTAAGNYYVIVWARSAESTVNAAENNAATNVPFAITGAGAPPA